MLQVIIGKKGSGKTKQLIEKVNAAASVASGNVVFISDDTRANMYDVMSKVRMVETAEFGIKTYEQFYGFIAGIISGNFDITDIFIDGALRIVGGATDGLEAFLESVDKVAAVNNTNIAISVSMDAADAPAGVQKYI